MEVVGLPAEGALDAIGQDGVAFVEEDRDRAGREGIVPAPEPARAIAGAIREAERAARPARSR